MLLVKLFSQPLHSFSWLIGKVHGSLARAGKVKGQTPKVSWQYFCMVPFVFQYFTK